MEEESATAFGQQTLKRAILQATAGWVFEEEKEGTTVDGRNPAPVDMDTIPLFTGFHR